MLRTIILISLFTVLILAFPAQTLAIQEFTTSLNATYTISSQSVPQVKNEIHIKNNFSTIYSTQFALEVGSTSVKNIRAYDQLGKELKTNIAQTEKRTTVALQFKDKILGKDNERVFTIEYEYPDAAITQGKVLEVDVPKLAQKDMFQAMTVRVIVPAVYGTPAAISPAGYSVDTADGTQTFTFGNSASNGINMLFGESQNYAFTLRYHLNNPSISQGVSQVALPPDTAFQRIVYTSIDPKPDSITADADGNWIATFSISPQKDLTVTATGVATLFLKPTVQIDPVQDLKQYLKEQPFWETNDPQVQLLAKKLKTPRAIYDYLVQNYDYDYQRLAVGDQRRRGSSEALRNPANSLCQEFTDTFIAIARAAGIPARELNGFSYTENAKLRPAKLTNDLLHAWPEYYDEERKLWIPVDPTWGKTTNGVDFFNKLDFNHIVFVIHGTSSEKPYSAGMYKVTGQEGKDVEVKLTPLASDPLRSLTLAPPTFLKPNIITIENNTGSAWYDVPVKTELTSALALSGKRTLKLSILPYQKKEFEIPVAPSSLIALGRQKGTVIVTIGDETVQYETTVGTIGNIRPAVAVGIGFGVCTLLAGGVLVLRRKR